MFFGYVFQGLITLFAFIFIKQCLSSNKVSKSSNKENDETSVEFTTTAKPTTTLEMDDLSSLDMAYYCKFQANSRSCTNRRTTRKYFFDIKLQKCVHFQYGNCNHSYNMFDRREDCMDSCRDAVHEIVKEDVTFNVFCRYQPDFGDCNSYHPRFYYDVVDGKCKGFSYSGCGGNRNRFASSIECLDVCGLLYIHKW